MRTFKIKGGVASVFAALALLGSQPVSAQPVTPPNSSTTAATFADQTTAFEMERAYLQVASALWRSSVPRTVEQTSGPYRIVTFHLKGLDFAAAFQGNKPVISIPAVSSSTGVTPQLSVGIDWLGPYVRLNSAEQAAAAAGATGVIAAIICGATAAPTAGASCAAAAAIATAVVGVISANGVCPRGRDMKVYWIWWTFRCA